MKKLLLAIICYLIFYPVIIIAQTEPILVELYSSTYELLENPISVNNNEVWESDFNYAINLDFEFEINGQFFNEVIITAGNGLSFQGYNNPKLWIWGSEWGGSGYLYDVGVSESESPIDYEVFGDESERIVKIQWQNAGILNQWPDNFPDDPDDFVNFQFWIFEGTNEIEVHYGPSQSSDSSFDQNDGPGFRFLKIDDHWGYCFSGYENLPFYVWTDFTEPLPGCLLNGIPNEEKVIRFYPNTPTLTEENISTFQKGFSVHKTDSQNEVRVQVNNYDRVNSYSLTIYNLLGVNLGEYEFDYQSVVSIDLSINPGIYIFVMNSNNRREVQKIMLQ